MHVQRNAGARAVKSASVFPHTTVRMRQAGVFTLFFALTFALFGCGDAESGEDPGSEAIAAGGEATAGEASAPAEAPPAPRPILPDGTLLTFEVLETVSTQTHSAGDEVRLRLVESVSGTEGGVLSAGASARAVITESRESAGTEEEAVLALQVASVEVRGSQRPLSDTIESADTESASRASGQRQAATVATGAAAGAVLGQILGRDTRSTAAGAAVGAVAGLGIALTTREGHATLHEGSRITVRLHDALALQ